MDIGKSFTYMFEDKKWIEKILIGGLLGIIPIVNFIPVGYALRALKNRAENRADILPDWDDWGGDWVRGALVFVASLVYAIPILLLAIPYGIVMAVTQQGSGEGGVCSGLYSCGASLWGIVMAIVLPAGIIKYATEGTFGSFFRFSEIFRFISDNISNYIIALLLILVAGIAAGIVGSILCGIGLLFTEFWSYLVSAHLLGQVKAASTPSAGSTTFYSEPTPPTTPSEDEPSS